MANNIVCVEIGHPKDNHVNWMQAAIRVGELDVESVQDMVTKVIAKSDGRPINRLTLIGHGSPGIQSVGCGQQPDWTGRRELKIDMVTERLIGSAEDELLRLASRFAPEAMVSLGGCQVGAGDYGRALLRRISNILGGVTAQATEVNQRAGYKFDGPVVRCKGDTCWIASAESGLVI